MKNKNKIILILLVILTDVLYSQQSSPKVKIISSFFNKGEYNVKYIINNSKQDETYDIKLLLFTQTGKPIRTFTVNGDKDVFGGQVNLIRWYWSKDRDSKPYIDKQKIVIENINKINIQYSFKIEGLANAKIYIDDDFKGLLKYRNNYVLSPGRHTLKAKLSGYETYETSFDLISSGQVIKFNLRKNKGDDDLVARAKSKRYKPKPGRSHSLPSVKQSAVQFCLLGNRKLSRITPKWSIYGAFHRQSFYPALFSTAIKYPFHNKVENRNLYGGGLNFTLLPLTVEAEVLFEPGIKAKELSGTEQLTNLSDSTIFKMYFYRLKIGLCPVVLFEKVYPVFGVTSQTAHLAFQKDILKTGIDFETKSFFYQEFGLFANITLRMSDTWVLVVGYENFYKEEAFDGSFYLHLGIYLK